MKNQFIKIKEIGLIINKEDISTIDYIQGEKQSEVLFIGDKLIIKFKNNFERVIRSDKVNGLKFIMEKLYKEL